jgi:hypothetical protein
VRRRHTSGILTIAAALTLGACTPTTTSTSTPNEPPTASEVRYGGITFDVTCSPVAEALTDVDLPRHGQPKLRAITGLWDHQAIAVLANDPKGCGLWTLAIALGLTDRTRTEIEAEVERGIEHFGVTASPVPRMP